MTSPCWAKVLFHLHSEGVSVAEATGQRPSKNPKAKAKPAADEAGDTDESKVLAVHHGTFGNMDYLTDKVDAAVF